MELFELVLILLGSVLLSSLLEQIIPRVSLPLVQIALGILIAVFAPLPIDIELDPELFLVLFIAPLLFDESRRADKQALWSNKFSIISLAIGLVVIVALVVGFSLHQLIPSIPLAAAFALGAALGPTDAVAVASLGKNANLSTRQKALLSGEALINDATGVVSFQFAIAAAVTGAFSLADAGVEFAISFFGGILLGAVLGLISKYAIESLRSLGLESTTVHVTFEVVAPFAIFLIAEELSVSGVLAVVAAGLTMIGSVKRVSTSISELKIVSNSVWEVLVFILNGIVFVLLGMQLPDALSPTWTSPISNAHLIFYVLAITVVVELIRFLWVVGLELMHRRKSGAEQKDLPRSQFVKDCLITTFAGPKGAVTLSIAFTIPYVLASGDAFPYRSMLIFIAGGVIICTLLLANFMVPLLSGAAHGEDEDQTEIEVKILVRVINQLEALKEDGKPDPAIDSIVRGYRERIAHMHIDDVSIGDLRAMRDEVLAEQRAFMRDYVDPSDSGDDFSRRCYEEQVDDMLAILEKRSRRKRANKNPLMRPFMHLVAWSKKISSFKRRKESIYRSEAVRKLIIAAEEHAVEYLSNERKSSDSTRAASALILLEEHKNSLAALRARKTGATEALPVVTARFGPVNTSTQKTGSLSSEAHYEEMRAEALRLELEQIQRMRELGMLSRSQAADMREDVYVLQMSEQVD